MKRYIASVGFSNDGDSLMVLRDDPNGKSGELQPTKENILEALHWLALGAEGDSLLLHFSGTAWWSTGRRRRRRTMRP